MTDPRPLGTARRVAGPGGLPAVELSLPNGARAVVCLHGAHVVSYVPEAGAEELLYLSPRSEFRRGIAIRGGVPVIFPQFAGLGPLPKHGFARTLEWELADSWSHAPGESAGARLTLRDTPDTRGVWPHAFALHYEVRLTQSALQLALLLENVGDGPLRFTGALHSYLRVADVRQAVVEGLEGVRYIDKTAGRTTVVDEERAVAFDGEVDRIYLDAPSALRVVDSAAAGRTTVRVESAGFPDVVVWNPGPEKAAALADLGADEYTKMLCVEAALVGKPRELSPGESWNGSQTIMRGDAGVR
ncbi:MAG TPA: D-hexose-6-phosphate mutarotase [Gemmatimonadaceae bacterium]|nr:D-hexose-6-phosphate mutarotase [Gemmatimonadaceae bacterium]